MFEIGWSELLVIAIVAIVVIGPKDLPRAMRVVGQWTGRMKRMAREFQGQFNEALREAELADVRKDVETIGNRIKDDVAKAGADIDKSMQVKAPETAATPASGLPPPVETEVPQSEPVEVAPAPSPEPTGVAGEAKP
jgi:sec-independent protein translocase protein TatB